MKFCRHGFNLYLVALVLVGVVCGCKTEKSKAKKISAFLRMHEEVPPNPAGRSETVVVHRAPEIKMTIDKEAFLTSSMVKEAKVVDVVGGFALQLEFNRRGSWLLEQYTLSGRGRHIAIFCQFMNEGEEKLNEGRWLAAPRVSNIITNGQMTFTPDATRAEADQIVKGLNNVAKQLETGNQWDF